MKRDGSRIWGVPVYLPSLHPDLTPQTIAAAEKRLGVKLPAAYLDLLQEQNGGYVRRTLPDSVHSMIWGIGPSYPSITDDFEWRTADADAYGMWRPDNAAALVPFDGDGHWHLCLDYRACGPQGEPSVAYIDLETESEEQIASDFASFLDLLCEEIDPNTLGIVGDWTLGTATAALAKSLNAPFRDMGLFDHGYPLYRCELGTEGMAEWVWMSPNEVPRGFVRKSDPRHDELIGLLPGTALRMPQYPEVKLILEFTSGVAQRVRSACAGASVSTKELFQAI